MRKSNLTNPINKFERKVSIFRRVLWISESYSSNRLLCVGRSDAVGVKWEKAMPYCFPITALRSYRVLPISQIKYCLQGVYYPVEYLFQSLPARKFSTEPVKSPPRIGFCWLSLQAAKGALSMNFANKAVFANDRLCFTWELLTVFSIVISHAPFEFLL